MISYLLIKDPRGSINCVYRSDGWSIPFDPANSDYQQFKIQVADGTPLEDPDGNVMTQEQVDEFLRTIP
jgi:hypothetical protein